MGSEGLLENFVQIEMQNFSLEQRLAHHVFGREHELVARLGALLMRDDALGPRAYAALVLRLVLKHFLLLTRTRARREAGEKVTLRRRHLGTPERHPTLAL